MENKSYPSWIKYLLVIYGTLAIVKAIPRFFLDLYAFGILYAIIVCCITIFGGICLLCIANRKFWAFIAWTLVVITNSVCMWLEPSTSLYDCQIYTMAVILQTLFLSVLIFVPFKKGHSLYAAMEPIKWPFKLKKERSGHKEEKCEGTYIKAEGGAFSIPHYEATLSGSSVIEDEKSNETNSSQSNNQENEIQQNVADEDAHSSDGIDVTSSLTSETGSSESSISQGAKEDTTAPVILPPTNKNKTKENWRTVSICLAIFSIALFTIILFLVVSPRNNELTDELVGHLDSIALDSVAIVGDTVVYEEEVVPLDEYDENSNDTQSNYDDIQSKNLQFVKNAIIEARAEYPEDQGNGTTITNVDIEGDYVIYTVVCDEDFLDIDALKSIKSELKQEMSQTLKSNDPMMKYFKGLCKKANLGIGYRFKGNQTNKSFVIKFANSEL